MYLDSNVLISQLILDSSPSRGYADIAFSKGGLVMSEVLVEVFGVVERETRKTQRETLGHFGEADAKKYRRDVAGTILSWITSGNITVCGDYTTDAIRLMCDTGLDFVDCLLIQVAYSGAGKVVTSDKGVRSAIGSFLWEPTT